MNETILHNVNSTVKEDDTLYFLGDFAFGDKTQIPRLRDRIKCRNLFLIKGNHDHKLASFYRDYFSFVRDYYEFRHNKTLFCLMHYPLHVWNEHARGAIHLFGHSHGSLGPQVRKREDVGFDCYPCPVSIDYIVELMKPRQIDKVDHHNERTTY